MAGLKEIRRRITSVKNTRQITRAMKLVSAAKLRRAQDGALQSRLFNEKTQKAVSHIISSLPAGFTHPFLKEASDVVGAQATATSPRSTVLPERVIVILSDRGLCGPYNSNVIKAFNEDLAASGRDIEVVTVGRRAGAAATRFGWKSVASYEGLPEDVAKWPVREIISDIIEDYLNGKCGAVSVLYTKFVTVLTQQIALRPLLPFLRPENSVVGESGADVGVPKLSLAVIDTPGETELEAGLRQFSPSPEEIFRSLASLFVQGQLRQCCLDARASEHAARMTAMESATKNAGELIKNLQLKYNRARQTAITTELIDIVGGAESFK